MKISIIITAYNCEQYIQKSLQSIFSQSFPPNEYEIIIVNDGSTDNTLDILKSYKNKITLIDQENRGFVSARNRGIQASNGENIIMLDPDDYFDREMLSKSVSVLTDNPEFQCVYTDRYHVNIAENTVKKVPVGKDNILNMIAGGILFKKNVFKKIGLYDDLLFEEYDFMIRFFKHFNGAYLKEYLYYYVKHGANMTLQEGYWEKGSSQLLDKWGPRELEKWVQIQTREEGGSRFLELMNK